MSITKAKASASGARAKKSAERPGTSVSEHWEHIVALKGIIEIIYQAQKDKVAVRNAQRGYGLVRY